MIFTSAFVVAVLTGKIPIVEALRAALTALGVAN
jgi:hypothetical protein